MDFAKHYNLEGRHAFLSPSNYAWIRYDDEKFDARWFTAMAAQRGTELHELAKNLIRLGVKLPNTKNTLNLYVNDAIGYRMVPEQILYYSDNCFGTADTISFRRSKGRWILRIHDLKTGISKASVDQLLVYAALFCLEYSFMPFDIEYDLRIYQEDEVQMFETDPADIVHIMDRIKTFDKRIEVLKASDD